MSTPPESPFERMEAAYAANPEPHPFSHYVDWHHRHGFVFSTPEFFVQGFAVNKDKLGAGVYPLDCYDRNGDCWYVADMAGDMSKAWSILPWELPFIGWHRDTPSGKDLHLVPLRRIRRLTKGL